MAEKPEGFDEGLTIAAIVLAAIAIVFWAVPLLPTTDPYFADRGIAKMFSGLTDFGASEPIAEAWRGRLPAFLVAAFSSIFLLMLRRRC